MPAGYLSPAGESLWKTRGGLARFGALGRIWGRPWGVAKLVRRLTLDQEIVGSNPTAPANRPRLGAPRTWDRVPPVVTMQAPAGRPENGYLIEIASEQGGG